MEHEKTFELRDTEKKTILQVAEMKQSQVDKENKMLLEVRSSHIWLPVLIREKTNLKAFTCCEIGQRVLPDGKTRKPVYYIRNKRYDMNPFPKGFHSGFEDDKGKWHNYYKPYLENLT